MYENRLYKHYKKEEQRSMGYSKKRPKTVFHLPAEEILKEETKVEVKPVKYVQAMTDGQDDYITAIAENQIVLCYGPAGSGKSHIPLSMAGQYLLEGKVKKILISRPIAATSAKTLGALPGELAEKYNPYLIAILEELKKYFNKTVLDEYIRNGTIELAPLELMRGRTFNDTFMCLDEASSCTFEQLSMFLTRIGNNSQAVINGDFEQSDLQHKKDQNSFMDVVDLLDGVPGIGIVELTEDDIVRSGIIKYILRALRNRDDLYKVDK